MNELTEIICDGKGAFLEWSFWAKPEYIEHSENVVGLNIKWEHPVFLLIRGKKECWARIINGE